MSLVSPKIPYPYKCEHLSCHPLRSGWSPSRSPDIQIWAPMSKTIQDPGELLDHGAVLAGPLCHAYIHMADRPQMFKPTTVKKTIPTNQEFNLSWCEGFWVSVSHIPSHAPRTCTPPLWIHNWEFKVCETRRRTEKQQPNSTVRKADCVSVWANKPCWGTEKK